MNGVPFEDLPDADLTIDQIYEAGPMHGHGADPLQRLLPVGNQGGFRFSGRVTAPRLVVLFSTGRVSEWPDEFDASSGILTYYGDNRKPGRDLHSPSRGGNQILRDTFARFRQSPEIRAELPVFLLFEAHGATRSVRFRGLVVPGNPTLEHDEELAAIWRTAGGERFQNYRSKFTALDIAAISRTWIHDILRGKADSAHAPSAWRAWVSNLHYQVLAAPPLTPIRSKDEQLPASDDSSGWQMLKRIYSSYREQPVGFEKAAAELVRLAVPLPTSMDVTRPNIDGGRDAIGLMQVGPSLDPVAISIAMEAKCYNPGQTAVSVKDTSRLVSRLKNRELGFLVTTSYVAKQAYTELRHDRHPVVVLAGGDLVRELRRRGVHDPKGFDAWARSIN